MNKGVYLFYGEEGSGKSTHARLLSEFTGLPYVSSGELIRQEEEKGSEIGNIFKSRQTYVANDLMIPFMREVLKDPQYEKGFIIEGFPRNLEQFQALEALLSSKGLNITRAIYVTLPLDLAVARLMKRGRPDDTPEEISRRLQAYREHRKEMLSSFEQRGILLTISNEASIESVQHSLRNELNV